MPDETPQRRTSQAKAEAEAEVETQEEEAPAVEEYVDPYKMVYSPWELPANTTAAQAIAAVVTVDPAAPISAERQAQAEAAIQDHQDNVQELVAGISEDPRLSGVTFEEHAVKQAEESATRAVAREEARA